MTDQEQFRFVSLLANELGHGKISLPSLPDVVSRIRDLLEKDSCDFNQISRIVTVDPILVSQLFVFANSAYYSQTGKRTDSLDIAIGRLGFELVRNTAMSLAVKQLMLGEKHKEIAPQVRNIWARSMKLSALAFAIADQQDDINAETAYMCGLFYDVGQLYILTKAKDFPSFLGDTESLQTVLDEWRGPTSKSIVEAWEFPEPVCSSMQPSEHFDDLSNYAPTLSDVIYVADLVLSSRGNKPLDYEEIPSCERLGICEESMPEITHAYEAKLHSTQQSLAAAS